MKSNPGWMLVAVSLVFAVALPASAGLLDTGTPYDDGVNDPWTGTTAFSGLTNPDLAGTLDWVVFGPGDFPFAGYTPTLGGYTYVYQLNSTGSEIVSSLTVPINYSSDNIGTFSDPGNGVTGVAPSAMALSVPGSAIWDFLDPGVGQDGSSQGLAFSSPHAPVDWYSIVIDGGSLAYVIPSPSPGPNGIPEPSALILLASGLMMVLVFRFRGRNA